MIPSVHPQKTKQETKEEKTTENCCERKKEKGMFDWKHGEENAEASWQDLEIVNFLKEMKKEKGNVKGGREKGEKGMRKKVMKKWERVEKKKEETLRKGRWKEKNLGHVLTMER